MAEPSRVVAVNMDVTERKRAEEAVFDLNRMFRSKDRITAIQRGAIENLRQTCTSGGGGCSTVTCVICKSATADVQITQLTGRRYWGVRTTRFFPKYLNAGRKLIAVVLRANRASRRGPLGSPRRNQLGAMGDSPLAECRRIAGRDSHFYGGHHPPQGDGRGALNNEPKIN